ncbi:hypothetical protein [Stenotrophomonas sp. PD6]|uniref:hypothetical protein n=1 Tax=Stenotrophomonas sp. PD6 TaxID=3368612 RepID=UPI003BA1BAEC
MRTHLVAAVLVGVMIPAIATGASRGEAKTQLESVLLSAIREAKRCGVDVDNVDVNSALQDEAYRITFVARGKRGGGAEVVVERASARVQTSTCLQ